MAKKSLKSPEHIQAQKEKILEAAKKAFRMHGFHSATMSQIAKHAGVSQGLAYRYFENKDAIIETIVIEEQRKMQVFLGELKNFDDLLDSAILYMKMLGEEQPLPNCFDPIIYLELRSESNRNPSIDSIVQSWDAKDMALFQSFVKNCYEQIGRTVPESLIKSRLNLMGAVFDGLSMRIRSFEFTSDMETELKRTLRNIFEI